MNHAARHPGVADVNPKPILDMNYAFAQTALLMAAVRLHLFTYLASDPLTATALATLVETKSLSENLDFVLKFGLPQKSFRTSS